jgi:type II secretory ATPase GspE/PulE/Tfp pilus assembly ATPase PilB-like protein
MRLGEILVATNKLTAADLERALLEQRRHPGRRLGEVLVAMHLLGERDLAMTLARELGLPFVDLAQQPILADAVSAVPPSVILRHHVVPIDLRDGAIVVALADPLDVDARDAVRLSAGRPIVEVVAMPSQVASTIAALLHPAALPAPEGRADDGDIDAILREIACDPSLDLPSKHGEAAASMSEQSSAIIRLVNRVLVDAYGRGASDVHLEPKGVDGPVRVRFRVDGDCAPYRDLPAGLGPSVVARVKILADLDIAEHRKPQDGKIRFPVGEGALELRVATIPTTGGVEDAVLRLLPPSKPRPVEALGLAPRNLLETKRLLAQPYGLFLCVGPTGSGKTTTLHAALGALNKDDVKIWTAEDPVEITQPGLRQVQVNRKAGLDFAAAMRSFLRADPDVIMVGEMRDRETALTAIEASLTGHLVLSTLHTNNAPETVTRLLEMGMDPFAFADSLLGVLAQRLVRALCEGCKEPCAPSQADLDAMARAFGGEAALRRAIGDTADAPTLWRGAGCDQCGGSGYKGRIAIRELLVVDDALRAIIAHPTTIEAVRDLAVAGGMTTLLQDGVTKAVAGATDLRQVLATCSR